MTTVPPFRRRHELSALRRAPSWRSFWSRRAGALLLVGLGDRTVTCSGSLPLTSHALLQTVTLPGQSERDLKSIALDLDILETTTKDSDRLIFSIQYERTHEALLFQSVS